MKLMKKFFSLALSLALALSCTILPASALTLEQAKRMLADYYADSVPQEALNAETLEDLIAALGDPYTVYMSSDEYQSFLSGVNGSSVVGIGVSIQNAYENGGYQILSILPDSPALDAGLEAGDIIVSVDGVAVSAERSLSSMIGGEEGTSVTVTVVRPSTGTRKSFTMTRRSVTIPIVTYEQRGSVGYINCTSFGDSTIDVVAEAIETMDDETSVWVMDLRSNPGGTADAAAGSAGLFVGSEPMVYFRDADDNYTYIYTLPNCPDLTDKPLIILTSAYSASGSELFSAAARDYGFAIAVGQRTYGKGIAQSVYDQNSLPQYFSGDAFKITTSRFFSPNGTTNHIVGLLPTLLVSEANTADIATLLATPAPSNPAQYLKLELAGQTFYLDLSQATQLEERAAFEELLEALPPSATLYRGTNGGWEADPIAPADLAEQLELPFTARTFSDVAESPFAREINTLATYELLSGYEDGTFRPENAITRAEFCAMVATALDLPANENALTFSDTPADAWFADAVSAMSTRGFIAGYEDGTFRPDSTITYQEMVTILSAVAAWSNMNSYDACQEELTAADKDTYSQFADWAQSAARNLDQLDALVGDQTPDEAGTRQVAAGLLCTLMENINLLWD